jgi:hypothetical protein
MRRRSADDVESVDETRARKETERGVGIENTSFTLFLKSIYIKKEHDREKSPISVSFTMYVLMTVSEQAVV